MASTRARSPPVSPSPRETMERVLPPRGGLLRGTAGPAMQTRVQVESPVESAVPHPREWPRIP